MGGEARHSPGGRTTRRWLTVAVAALVLVAGCTGIPSTGTPDGTDNPTATATVTPTATATVTPTSTAGAGSETPTRTQQPTPTPTRTAATTATPTPRSPDTQTATTEPSGTRAPRDADADSYTIEEDCDDSDETVYPGAPEQRDGKDNDCDGRVDEDTTPTPTPTRTSQDADADGYTTEEDCNDSDETVYPGAEEVRDGKDNDCDGQVDEDTTPTPTPTRTPQDADADGYTIEEDCNDNDETVHPGAEEVRDGKDNDCDGRVDEDTTPTPTPTRAPQDADADGYTIEEDCNDNDETVYPGAPEQRDGKDNDCDGRVDEDTTPTPTP